MTNLGEDRAEAIMQSLFVREIKQHSVTNPEKLAEIKAATRRRTIYFIPVGLVKHQVSFAGTDYFAKVISIQDESSHQYLVPINLFSSNIQVKMKILDACAAPGGKTTHVFYLYQ